MNDIDKNNMVEHIKMTGDTKKDSLTLSRLPGDIVHIVCKDREELSGFVWSYIDTGESGNSMPFILLEEDLDSIPVELYANDIEYIDVIQTDEVREQFSSL